MSAFIKSSLYPDPLIESMFNILNKLGTILGCRLVTNAKCGKLTRICRYLSYWCVIGLYWMSLILLVCTMIPTPSQNYAYSYNAVIIAQDVRTVFPVLLCCAVFDGLCSFVTANTALVSLYRNEGYFDQFRIPFFARMLNLKSIRRWRRFVLISMVFSAIFTIQHVGLIIVYALNLISMPLDITRPLHYLSIPSWVVYSILALVAFVNYAHVSYHNIIFAGLCQITRLRFVCLCDRIKQEVGGSFHQRRLDYYHAEFRYLAGLVRALDNAFNISIFLQFCALAVGVCLSLYFYTRGDYKEWRALAYVGIAIFVSSASFIYTALPAIQLRSQARRPYSHLYTWFVEYQVRVQLHGSKTDEASRQAFALFVQSLLADTVGISAAGLFYFDGQALLTFLSAVATYFLFIVQFGVSTGTSNGCIPSNGTLASDCG